MPKDAPANEVANDRELPDPEPDPVSVARTICLRLLTVRARSRAELAGELSKRGVPDEAANAVLSRLTDVGLIDDRAYAEAFTRSRTAERGLARREIERQLRSRGVDPDIAGEAVSGLDNDHERRTALALVRKKQRPMAALDQATQTRRLAGMLARKGYSAGMAYSVVREVLGDSGLSEYEPD